MFQWILDTDDIHPNKFILHISMQETIMKLMKHTYKPSWYSLNVLLESMESLHWQCSIESKDNRQITSEFKNLQINSGLLYIQPFETNVETSSYDGNQHD